MFPWLVLLDGEKQAVCDVISKSRISATAIPDVLTNAVAVKPTTNHGWWFIVNRHDTAGLQPCLWNPLTSQLVSLPQLDFKVESIDYVMLAKTPSDPDCTVLLLADYDIMSCSLNRNDRMWMCRSMGSYDEDHLFVGDSLKQPVVCQDGRMFMWTGDVSYVGYSMVQLEILKPRSLLMTPLQYHMCPSGIRSPWPRYDHNDHHYVACLNDVFAVEVNFGGVDCEKVVNVSVSRFDFLTESWTVAHSCPNVVFFITAWKQAVALPVDSVEVGNRIYLAGLVDCEKRPVLYIYHIREKTLSCSLLGEMSVSSSTALYWMLLSPDAPVAEVDNELMVPNTDIFVSADDGGGIGGGSGGGGDIVSILPLDIWRRITCNFMKSVDYLNFREASRFCSSVFPAKGWRSMSELGDGIVSSHPWLMIPSPEYKGVSSMIDPFLHKKYYIVNQEREQIVYSKDGWLLLFSSAFPTLKLRFYNPITKSTICLPEGHRQSRDCDQFYFTSSPTSPDCIVYAASLNWKLMSYLELGGEDGQMEWHTAVVTETLGFDIVVHINTLFINQTNTNVVFDGYFFYFLLGGGNLASMERKIDGILTLKSHVLGRPCRGPFEQSFLMEYGDEREILSIYVGKEMKWLEIFKLKKVEMEWVAVVDIEENNIYLSVVSSMVIKAEPPGMGNRIYLPRLFQEFPIYYSLETGKFHAGPMESEVTDYYGTKEQLGCCWFQPSLS